MDINQQAPCNGGTVSGPPDHIRSLHQGYGVQRKRSYTGPIVAGDSSGCPTEGHVKKYFGRRMGSEATGIRQAWREGGSVGR